MPVLQMVFFYSLDPFLNSTSILYTYSS